MSCLIHLAALCLFDPSSIYVTGGLDFSLNKARTASYSEGAWCDTDWCKGPRSQLRIGMNTKLTREWSADWGVLHTSYIAERYDRGDESAFVTLTWRPWK